MIRDSQLEIEKFYIFYNRILYRFKMTGIKTKYGKEITHKDLRQAINIMNKKHSSCRWKCQKLTSYKHYILAEGFYWLMYVYFQNEKKQIDADIDFFELRIKLYEDLLKIETKNFWEYDMYVYELKEYFHRAPGTIKNAITKMNKLTDNQYKYYENGKAKITKEGIEWLCKNCFKKKYLELLEDYKMELTEKYIEAGYVYDVKWV